jgi:hypothetical protein
MERDKMSEGVAFNQGEISEETRAMVLHQKAIMGLMDEILAVQKNPHASLIRDVKRLQTEFILQDPVPVWEVSLLDKVIKALGAH